MANNFSTLVEKLTAYVEVKIELIKINLINASSKVLANLIVVFLLTLLFSLFFLFLSIGIANLLNAYLNSQFWGYFIIAGFYLTVIIVLIFISRKGKVQSWLESAMLKTQDREED